ncbi:hypothetical protein AQUCO_01100059v1 [Aquilegia coerulea]|uniref:CID domain-containing protein n=1 Tax=Aquilegia coerulea TaxID=218851 RepID=A0A2G5E5D2_AQUCA|nr:hypothetical protein AQUCO_01100059v1 [Aquilegia coerulea]
MNGTFNPQILVDKLARLNSSQQSIETLSHWCIFHMNKAKQVVETWARQFHCSPREQRLSFLYLANDILQNSRRKGSEFVAEFWKVLPDALNDMIENGDELGKNSALRLVDIWDQRKVFGSRGKLLKEGIAGRNSENANRDEKSSCLKSLGNILEKIISSYEVVYDGPVDENLLLSKCRSAIDGIDKVEKEIGSDYSSGQLNGSELAELQGQHGILRESIEQLRAAESSRARLVSHLREALQEQEFKLDEVRTQLQAAQSQSERAGNMSQRLLNLKTGQFAEHRLKEPNTFSDIPSSLAPETTADGREKEQSAPVMYTQRGPSTNSSYVEDDPRKSAAAAVAAKLAASTSSAQMLTYVLSSLASEGVIGNQSTESSGEYPSEKKPKLENGQSSYLPSPQHSQPPLPPFPHPDTFQPPPPSSSSPMSHPGPTMQLPVQQPTGQPPATQFMQTGGTMPGGPYNYGSAPQRPPPFPGYPMVGAPLTGVPPYTSPNPYQNYGQEGGFLSQPPMPTSSPPMSRQ